MKVTTKGQVTIPLHIRRKLGIKPHSEVEFVDRDDHVEIVKVENLSYRHRLEKLRGTLKLGMTTDEFMRLIRGDD